MKPEVVSGLKSFEKATFTSSLQQMLESLGTLIAQKSDLAAVNERNRTSQAYQELAKKLIKSRVYEDAAQQRYAKLEDSANTVQ